MLTMKTSGKSRCDNCSKRDGENLSLRSSYDYLEELCSLLVKLKQTSLVLLNEFSLMFHFSQ